MFSNIPNSLDTDVQFSKQKNLQSMDYDLNKYLFTDDSYSCIYIATGPRVVVTML